MIRGFFVINVSKFEHAFSISILCFVRNFPFNLSETKQLKKTIKTIKLICNYKPWIIVTLKFRTIATRITMTKTPKTAEISDVQIAEISYLSKDVSE